MTGLSSPCLRSMFIIFVIGIPPAFHSVAGAERFLIDEIKKCLEYEELIDYKNMIYNAVKNEEIIKINYNQENEFSDIL